MSTISVSKVETRDSSTPLTLGTGNASAGFIKIEASNNRITISDDLIIDANGNVSVVSSFAVTGNLSTLGYTPTTNGIFMGFESDGLGSTYAAIELASNNGGFIGFTKAGEDSRGRILYLTASNTMQFLTATVARLTIDGNGRIGVSNTNPQGDLHVGGTLIVSQNNASQLDAIGEIAEFAHNSNSYAQIHVRNANTGTLASGDLVVTADVGTDTSEFIDLGVNSSTYNDPSFTIATARDGYLYTSNGNLAMGVANTTKSISLFAGGLTAAALRMRINPAGALETNTVNIVGNTVVSGALYANSHIGIGQGFANMNVISTVGSQIWNIPPGVRKFKVTAIGGGSAGGGSHALAGATGASGAPGGVAVRIFDYAPGVNQMTLNVGVGGISTTAVNANGAAGQASNVNYNGTVLLANGASGGANSWFGGNVNAVAIGGPASGGTINLTGANGNPGGTAAATSPLTGMAPPTPLAYGQPGSMVALLTGGGGANGTGFGAPGGGSRAGTGTTLWRGGFGSNGAVIIEW